MVKNSSFKTGLIASMQCLLMLSSIIMSSNNGAMTCTTNHIVARIIHGNFASCFKAEYLQAGYP